MILTHFGPDKFNFFSSKEYRENKYNIKPNGLWLSDENTDWGWKAWCESEEFNLDGLIGITNFECDTSNWCVLSNVQKILKFTKEYECQLYPGAIYHNSIDWNRIKKKYKGIVITPYQWKARLEPRTFWYYGWDCASACVWDLSTIMEINHGQYQIGL